MQKTSSIFTMADFKSELRKDQCKVLFAVTMPTEKNTNKKQNQNRKPTKAKPHKSQTTKTTQTKQRRQGDQLVSS